MISNLLKTLITTIVVSWGLMVLGCSEQSTSQPTDEENGIIHSTEDDVPGGEPSVTDVSDNGTPALTHVVNEPTEIYFGGPQQAQPPDATLEPGTKVSIVEESGSYIIVNTENGMTGYIAHGSLKPLERSNVEQSHN